MATLSTEQPLIESLVYGAPSDWEKHEIGARISFVKPLAAADALIKAQVAAQYDALGFIPSFFREQGREFVALEGVKARSRYSSIEQAFVEQILRHKEH